MATYPRRPSFAPDFDTIGQMFDQLPARPPDDPSLLWLTARFAVRYLMRPYINIQAYGTKHIPDSGAVIASNHAGHLDSIAIPAWMDDMTAALAARENSPWFSNNYMRLFGMHTNMLPLVRKPKNDPEFTNEQKALMAQADTKRGRWWMDQGGKLIIYPEGTRSRTGAMGPFKSKGIMRLLEGTEYPIVPTRVAGSYECLPPKGKKVPRPGNISVVFGKPITHEQWQGLNPDTLAELLYQRVDMLTPQAEECRATQGFFRRRVSNALEPR